MISNKANQLSSLISWSRRKKKQKNDRVIDEKVELMQLQGYLNCFSKRINVSEIYGISMFSWTRHRKKQQQSALLQ